MLSPTAYNLVYRNKRVLSTPHRTCHLVPRSMEFLVIRSFLVVSAASGRLTLIAHTSQLLSLSGFGKITIYRKLVALFLEENAAVLPSTKRPSFVCHRSVSNVPLHEATRAALSEMSSRVDDLNIRRDQIPDVALFSFL